MTTAKEPKDSNPVCMQLIMCDVNGIQAIALVEVDRWVAFKLEDMKAAKKFKPAHVLSVQVKHPNGTWVWPA